MKLKKITKPRKKPTQLRAQETVNSILIATAHILETEGYEGANTNQIAKVAGISIGSLYQYFQNKESVIATLIERYMDTQKKLVMDRITQLGDNSDLPAITQELVLALMESRSLRPRLQRVLVEEIPRVGKLRDLLDLYLLLSSEISTVLARHSHQHLGQPELDAFLWVHGVDAMVNACVCGLINKKRGICPTTAAHEISRLILSSLGLSSLRLSKNLPKPASEILDSV